MLNEDILWTEIYRPKKIEDCILPDSIKSTFEEYVKKVRFRIFYYQDQQV